MLSIVFLEVRGDGGARPTTQIIENIAISILSCLELGGAEGAAPTAQIIEHILIYIVFERWGVMGVPHAQIIEILANINKYNQIPKGIQTNTRKY